MQIETVAASSQPTRGWGAARLGLLIVLVAGLITRRSIRGGFGTATLIGAAAIVGAACLFILVTNRRFTKERNARYGSRVPVSVYAARADVAAIAQQQAPGQRRRRSVLPRLDEAEGWAFLEQTPKPERLVWLPGIGAPTAREVELDEAVTARFHIDGRNIVAVELESNGRKRRFKAAGHRDDILKASV